MKHSRRQFVKRAAVLGGVVAVAAAATPAPALAGTDVARFRVLHASPDGPALDVSVNNTRVASNLTYTKFTGTWGFAASTARVRAFPTGANPASDVPLKEVNLPLEIGKSYVIVVGDYVQVLDIFKLEDPPVPPVGQFTIRLAHLAPGTGPIDLTKSDGTPLIGGVAFKTAAPSTQPAGTYALQVKQSGGGPVLIDLGSRTFLSRERQTVYVFSAGATNRAAAAQSAPPFLFVRDR